MEVRCKNSRVAAVKSEDKKWNRLYLLLRNKATFVAICGNCSLCLSLKKSQSGNTRNFVLEGKFGYPPPKNLPSGPSVTPFSPQKAFLFLLILPLQEIELLCLSVSAIHKEASQFTTRHNYICKMKLADKVCQCMPHPCCSSSLSTSRWRINLGYH